jgi:hypothetical protein
VCLCACYEGADVRECVSLSVSLDLSIYLSACVYVWCMYVCTYLHAYQAHDDRADPEPAQESVGRPSEVCERERKGGRAWEREEGRDEERDDSQRCCVSVCTCVMYACACVCVRGSLLVWLGGGAVDVNTTLW